MNQTARLGRILELHRVADAPQTHAADDHALSTVEARRAYPERDLYGTAAF